MASTSGNLNRLYEIWRRVPAKLRENKILVKQYAQQLIAMDDHERCESLLRDAIKHQWDNDLVKLYGKTRSPEIEKQLHVAQGWLKGKENNPELLLCLGRLSIQNKLWGQARSFLESSLGYGPKAETYKELAMLLEKMNEKEAAADCYKKGLMLTIHSND